MRHLLVFRLAEDEFAMDVGHAVQVLADRPVKPVPELPDFISGVISLRDKFIPVIEMRSRLGLAGESPGCRFVVIRSRLGRVAIRVDAVKGVIKAADADIKRPPMVFRGIKKRFLKGLHGEGDSMVVVLDMENILNSEEAILLEKAVTAAGRSRR